MKKNELKTGDVIFEFYSGRIHRKHTIARTTKTQAIVRDGLRFRKEFTHPHFLRTVGSDRLSRTFKLETPVLHQAFTIYELRKRCKREVDFDKLSLLELRTIISLIDNPGVTVGRLIAGKKWCELRDKIAKFYDADNDDESALPAIGECAASAFGYL